MMKLYNAAGGDAGHPGQRLRRRSFTSSSISPPNSNPSTGIRSMRALLQASARQDPGEPRFKPFVVISCFQYVRGSTALNTVLSAVEAVLTGSFRLAPSVCGDVSPAGLGPISFGVKGLGEN
jgi:hypothetical protein